MLHCFGINAHAALGPNSDIATDLPDVRFTPDSVEKSLLGGDRKFLKSLMRFTRGEVRDHIVSSKIDHAPP